MAREIIVFRKVLKAGAIFAGGVEQGRKKGLIKWSQTVWHLQTFRRPARRKNKFCLSVRHPSIASGAKRRGLIVAPDFYTSSHILLEYLHIELSHDSFPGPKNKARREGIIFICINGDLVAAKQCGRGRARVCLFNSNYSPRAILPFLSSMTIRLRSLTLRDSPNSDSVSSPESQSQSLSFPLSHDFNAIKSSCWLVGTLGGALPFPFVSFALVGGVDGCGCLLCKTNKMEGGGCHNRPPSRKNSLPGGWMDRTGMHSGFIPHSDKCFLASS